MLNSFLSFIECVLSMLFCFIFWFVSNSVIFALALLVLTIYLVKLILEIWTFLDDRSI